MEKEKLRLQELELKQREEELKKNLEITKNRISSPTRIELSILNKSSEENANTNNKFDSPRPVSETVRKEDLNA